MRCGMRTIILLIVALLLTGCVTPADREQQNIQAIKCADGEIFYIHIPNLVWDVEGFSKGFCESL
jgi:hypothetical protein